MSGVRAVLPVDDGGFDGADWLADALAVVLAFALADDDALVLGVADALAEGEAPAACVGAWLVLVQVGPGVGWNAFWCVGADVGLGLGLGLWLELGLGDTVGVGVPLGLPLGVTPGLGLVLGPAEALALGLVVLLPPLWLPLDDVAGAVAFLVGLLAGLAVVSAWDGCADGDGHALGVVGRSTPEMLPEPSTVGGGGVLLWSSVALGPLDELLKAAPMALVTCSNPSRAGGMTARATPIANTAAPAAKAGRSIASRQSIGRFGARRASPSPAAPSRLESGWSPPQTEDRRRPRPARKPHMASHTPRAPWGRLA